MTGVECDFQYENLDYRCDPRITVGDPETVFVRPADGSRPVSGDEDYAWTVTSSDPEPDGTACWVTIDGYGVDGPVIGSYTSAEEAVWSLIGMPIPSVYIRDTRVEPTDRNGEPVGWDDDPEFFDVGYRSDVYHTHINDVPCWVANPYRQPATTWDLLDDAFRECLGDPDRAWNTVD